jgi:hypothetical protein
MSRSPARQARAKKKKKEVSRERESGVKPKKARREVVVDEEEF